jgi:hypothetical protein
MIVYAVYDCGDFSAVFSTEGKAEAFCKRQYLYRTYLEQGDMTIRPIEVDEYDE